MSHPYRPNNDPAGPRMKINFDHPEMIKGVRKIMSERKIIDYTILSLPYGVYDFSEYVKNYIEEGWQPLGGPYYDSNERKDKQAMVKYE